MRLWCRTFALAAFLCTGFAPSANAAAVEATEQARRGEADGPVSAQGRPSLADTAAERAFLEEADDFGFDPSAAGSARRIRPAERRLKALAPERTSPAVPLSILLQGRRRNE